jgi:hypothetical protein
MRTCALLILLGLAACQAPIESPVDLGWPQAPYDERLPGLWYAVDDEEPASFRVAVLIAPRAGSQVLDVLVSYGESGGEEPVEDKDAWRRLGAYRATLWAESMLGRTIYLARRDPTLGYDYTKVRGEPGFILLTVAFDERGDLTLAGLSGQLVKQYGANYGVHLIEEAIEGDDTYRLLDADQNELRGLVQAVGPTLFGERWGPLHRAPDDALPFAVKGIAAP